MRTSTLLVVTAAVAGLALTGCKATTGTSDGSVAGVPAAKNSAPKGAQAKYSGTCDADIGSGDGSDYALVSEVSVKNTGGVAVKATVLVSWPQYGHDPLASRKVVTLAVGKSKTVRFAKHVTMAQFSRAQGYQLKHDGALKCKYKIVANEAK